MTRGRFSTGPTARRSPIPSRSPTWRSAKAYRSATCSARREWAPDLGSDAVVTADLELKYAGYFARERDQAAKLRRMGEFRARVRCAVRRDAIALARGAAKARRNSTDHARAGVANSGRQPNRSAESRSRDWRSCADPPRRRSDLGQADAASQRPRAIDSRRSPEVSQGENRSEPGDKFDASSPCGHPRRNRDCRRRR